VMVVATCASPIPGCCAKLATTSALINKRPNLRGSEVRIMGLSPVH
jgi:hypothetical protein